LKTSEKAPTEYKRKSCKNRNIFLPFQNDCEGGPGILSRVVLPKKRWKNFQATQDSVERNKACMKVVVMLLERSGVFEISRIAICTSELAHPYIPGLDYS